MIPDEAVEAARTWNLADMKAMLAEVGVTVEVLSAEELTAEGIFPINKDRAK